ncbi:MAG: SSS family transporter [Candidatus Pseudothioglobus sp.]
MEEFRQEIILSAIGIYMVFCIAVGLWAMRRTHSSSDFFIAGRSLGPIVVALAIFSSTLSGFGFVGGPGLVYSQGVSSFWMIILSTTGYALGFFLVAKRIRMIAEVRDAISLPDIVAARYRSEAVRFLIALTIVLGVMGYLATQILAMAVVMKSLLSGTVMFADISLISCVVVSSTVLVFYCVTGGIIASVYTDVVQGGIMMVAGLLILYTATQIFDGGFAEATQIILLDDAEAMMPFGTAGVVTCLGWAFIFGLGIAGQPHLVTKMMMNRRIADNRTVLPVSVIGYAFAALLWISIGTVMRALVIDGQTEPLTSPDQAAPFFLSVFASPILAGIVFAGLFAAIMSTADAFLNVGTAALIHDMPKAFGAKEITNELFKARVVTVILAVAAAIIALASDTLVALLGTIGWGTFAAAIFPVLAIGLNWKGATKEGAIVAIVTSLVINVVVNVASIALPHGMNAGFLAFVSAIVLFIGVSLMTQSGNTLDDDIDRMMDF